MNWSTLCLWLPSSHFFSSLRLSPLTFTINVDFAHYKEVAKVLLFHFILNCGWRRKLFNQENKKKKKKMENKTKHRECIKIQVAFCILNYYYFHSMYLHFVHLFHSFICPTIPFSILLLFSLLHFFFHCSSLLSLHNR